jgi:uncharacterized SAM-binding protein YcdF (DUF218 family)
MFLLKKIISRFLFPVPLCLEVLAIGLLMLWFTRKQKTGKVVVSIAGALLLLFAAPLSSDFLMTPLEDRYPPLVVTTGGRASKELAGVKFIVVLGGGWSHDPGRPAVTGLQGDSIARLVEGIRVSKALNCCKLVLSGGGGPDSTESSAEDMAKFAQGLGVDRQDVILEKQSRDTEDEARFVQPIVGDQSFILVTEASHMPRAMALFRKQGTHPIADPMGYHTNHAPGTMPDDIFPNADGLHASERAVYEYLGLAWGKITGKL